ncbi:MAG: hypothetical protein Q4C66_15225 [Lachnospiraceae bacterium]|nr:hypothetical protein [Lachnospiraceae bacterium]
MGFLYKPPEWYSEGTEPEEDLKKKGFVAGYKPPAAYFNWFFNRVYLCLRELIDKAEAIETKVDTTGRVMIDAENTPLNVNDTLFIVDGLPDIPVTMEFEGAFYENMVFSPTEPLNAENWGQTEEGTAIRASPVSAAATLAESEEDGEPSIIKGKLVVSEEPTSDATFFAKINE